MRLLAHSWMLWLQTFIFANWMAFGIGQILVAASGVLPASMLAMMAGATLGFVRGFLLSAFATMLGGWLAFLLSRSVLRGLIRRLIRRYPAMAKIDNAVCGEGWRMVALLRVSPVMPFALTSYGFGLTKIRQRDYLLGTLASLPALILYVAMGALGKQGLVVVAGNATHTWYSWQMLELLFGALLVFYALRRVRLAVTRAVACNVSR